MHIQKVYYSELVSDPNSFSNKTVGMEAFVEPGDNWLDVFNLVKKKVKEQLGVKETNYDDVKREVLATVRQRLDHIDPDIPF